jgi:Ca-activated chloride channel family protein
MFLCIAASGPKIGTLTKPINRRGVDLVIALDTSISMNSDDVSPSRLEKAKFELGKLIKKLKGDRVAIIVFAGTSHIYLPLTTDYEAALLFLDEIDTKMIPSQGTSISSAINTAITAYQDDPEKFKVILLVSDGEDHEGEAIQISENSAKVGMIVNTVGVGSLNGGLVPVKMQKTSDISYKRNSDGKLITSIPNRQILEDISDVGNGRAFWFSNNGDSHISILDAIDNLEKKVISTHKFVEYEDRYQIFSIISLFFFLVHIVLPTKKLKNA